MESSGIVKEASASDLDKAAALLETIRSENPSLWPNGLTVGHFRPGNLWLIQKSAASEPVGFVGWQERSVDSTPTGYYSIGVLPEYRHQGIAKKAVARLLATKSSGVTRVRALVVPGNTPSEHLARSLDVPIEKQAAPPIPAGMWAKFVSKFPGTAKFITHPVTHAGVGGYGNMILQDNNMHPEEKQFGFFPFRADDKFRNQTAFTNFAIGGVGAGMASWGGAKMLAAKKPMEFAKGLGIAGGGASTMSSLIDKDLKMHGHKAIEAADSLSKSLPLAISRAAKDLKVKGGLGVGGVAAASLIAAALAGGGYQIAKAIKDKPVAAGGGEGAAPGTAAGGRIRVTLPTKNPNDSETTIDLPFDEFSALSPALRQRIERDTRRRLYAETNARTRRIGSEPLTAVTA
jgi:GNAT superfamily N-acetyltransferase